MHPAERPGPTGCLVRDDGVCVAAAGRCVHTRPTVEIVPRACEHCREPGHEPFCPSAAKSPDPDEAATFDAISHELYAAPLPPTPVAAKSWINTFSGRKFYPLTPDVGDVCIEDIAHALARVCRYTGQGSYYSVAEHCVKLADVVLSRTEDIGAARYALLHDATEAYLADVSTPVKQHPDFAFYREAEARLAGVIYRAFDLEPAGEPLIIKELDRAIRSTEVPQIFDNVHPDWKLEAPLAELLGQGWGWGPEDAERAFLDWFAFLFEGRKFLFKDRVS